MALRKLNRVVFIGCFLALFAVACGGKDSFLSYPSRYAPKYASGFSISGERGKKSSLITITNPWQGADSVVNQLFILRGKEKAPSGFKGQILKGEAKRIVAMSSTHIAMLEALQETSRVVGVSGKKFISNEYIRSHSAEIADVGYDNYTDYEALIALKPDIVLLYGITGASPLEGKLKEMEIPFVYIGDYVEESPLGKAEWMVAIAEIIGQRERGEEVFKAIPERYNSLKNSALLALSYKPKIVLNTPYRDAWFMPREGSYIVTLINEAGGEYIYKKKGSTASDVISTEEAYMLVDQADKWIDVGSANSLEELRVACPKFADTQPFIKGEVYNNTLRSNAFGGNDYWESGIVNPDLILRDLIKIFHPELFENEPFIYHKKLK